MSETDSATRTAETPGPSGELDPSEATREELIASLEGLELGTQAAEPAPAPPAAAPPTPAPGAPPVAGEAAPPAPAEPEVARLIRARESAEKERQGQRTEAERVLEEARAESARIVREAREAAARDAAAAREAFAREFRERPLEAINRAGIDKTRLVDDVSREGSPEWARARALEDQARASAELARKAEERAAAAEKATQAQQAEIHAWQRAQAEQQVLDLGATAAPTFAKAVESVVAAQRAMGVELTPQQVFLAHAHHTADLIRAAGGVASPANVVQYLEWEATRRRGAPTGAQGAPGTEATGRPATQGVAATESTGRTNGTARTLTAAGASERRAQPRPFDELSPADQRRAMIEEAEAAMRPARS